MRALPELARLPKKGGGMNEAEMYKLMAERIKRVQEEQMFAVLHGYPPDARVNTAGNYEYEVKGEVVDDERLPAPNS